MISPKIERDALRFLERAGLLSVPIDVEKCCEVLDITLRFAELEDNISGFLMMEGKKSVITVNKDHPDNRKRFTIAHEIGHFILHKTKPLFIDLNDSKEAYKSYAFRDVDSGTGEIRMEREANNFAAALLMPEKLLIDNIKKHKIFKLRVSDASEKLAKIFKVSQNAMEFRLANLDLIDYSYFAVD